MSKHRTGATQEELDAALERGLGKARQIHEKVEGYEQAALDPDRAERRRRFLELAAPDPPPCKHCGRLVLAGACCREAVGWTQEQWDAYVRRLQRR